MRGRKPKPIELRKLEGNPGKRAIPDDVPQPTAAVPNCPQHIIGEGRKEWRRISGELVKLSLVARVDKTALAMYCQLWQRWIEAEDAVRDLGLVVSAKRLRDYVSAKFLTPKGAEEAAKQQSQSGTGFLWGESDITEKDFSFPGKNPYLSIAESCIDRMQKLLVEFGMTPSSRARVKATPAETGNEIESILNGDQYGEEAPFTGIQ